MKTFFTVIIPTYNRVELLREAVRSVLNQSFKNFEVLIVDDHSTDNVSEIVSSFYDSRVKYVINDLTRGGAGTRNAGIFRAKGDWIAFLDDDDVWLPNKLELLFKRIKEVDEDVGLIYTGYASYDFDNSHEITSHLPEKEGWLQPDLLYKNIIGTLSIVTVRSDVLLKLGGLDERFEAMQDMELYVRIAGISRIVYIQEKLTYVRHSNADRISLNKRKKLNGSLLFWEKYRELINRNPRLRHRAASRVFEFAFQQGSKEDVLKALPWTLLGLIFDFSNFSLTLRGIVAYMYNEKIKT